MLLNNFKPLLFFGGNGSFKNVLGNTVNLSDYTPSVDDSEVLNNHDVLGTVRSFNYDATNGSNSFTDEQALYSWRGISGNVSAYIPSRYCNGFTLFVGTGNTAVSATDFKLASPANLDVVAAYCTTDATGIVTVSRTFKNSTGSSVNIKELGLYVFQATYDYEDKPVVMVGRKVFDSAVTIPNGEQRTFEYIINMNNITFTEADS